MASKEDHKRAKRRAAALARRAAKLLRAFACHFDGTTAPASLIQQLGALDLHAVARLLEDAQRFPTRVCMNCGTHFATGRSDTKTCSPACRVALHRRQNHDVLALRNFQNSHRILPVRRAHQREGAFAYDVLCGNGCMKRVTCGNRSKLLKAHREARRIFADMGLLPTLSAFMKGLEDEQAT